MKSIFKSWQRKSVKEGAPYILMSFLLLTAVAVLSTGSFQVQLRDGRSIEGQVVEASVDLVVVDAAGEQLRFAGD